MSRVMRAVRRARSRTSTSERGAALVEAAILIPLVLVLVFGAIEYGVYFKDAATVSGAARAGGRIAAAEPKVDSMADDVANAAAAALGGFPTNPPPKVWVYAAGANGYPVGQSSFDAASCTNDCVQYQLQWVTGAGGGHFQPQLLGGSFPKADQKVCPGTTDANWTRVGVYIWASHNRFFPNLLPSPSTVSDHAVFRLEPVASALCS